MSTKKDPNSPKTKLTDKLNNAKKGKKPGKPGNFFWIYAIVGAVLIGVNLYNYNSSLTKIDFNQFKEIVQEGKVNKLIVYNNEIGEVYLTKEALQSEEYKEKIKSPVIGGVNTGPHFSFTISQGDTYAGDIKSLADNYDLKVTWEKRDNWGGEILSWLLFLGFIFIFWTLIMRRMGGGGGAGGQLFNFSKSKAQLFDKEKSTNTTFKDVAGLQGAKEEVQEIVEFLKHPKKYTDLGAKIPKGALLVGPPGTGKTLLAKAVAGEAKVPFFSLSGSDFVEMFVGVGASRVRDLFKQAKEKAPCIIFIDEIDAIGRARGKGASLGGNDERENTLNQLLTEMDGFGTNSGVIILAATNRADVLDRALMRAGRFDRQIFVDMPDIVERKDIFKVHLKTIKIDDSVEIDFLAKQTPGFSGADIANICNEAALIAARKEKKSVQKQDFLDAVDRIIGGLEKKNKIITPQEKKTIAYHEAGHATISWLLEHASPLVKVTIVPRGQSLGAAWYLPEERQLNTKDQILDEMCAALGGRAAEKVVFDKISTGALSDLEKVTKQSYAMVQMYGLNDKVGNISFYDSRGQESFQKPYSDATATIMDQEASATIENQYTRAIQLLGENRDKLDLLAAKLLEKEVIFKEDLLEIFGKRPWDPEHEEVKPVDDMPSDSFSSDDTKSDEKTEDESSTTPPSVGNE